MHNSLIEKLENNERLNLEDGTNLYDLDIYTIGKYADKIRRKLNGNKVFYNLNRHINPTNICKDVCKFCAYSASRKNPNPYTMSHEDILEVVDKEDKKGISEVHIVSAHNDKVSLDWYMGIFRKIKDKYPHIHIKALSAAEVDFLAHHNGYSYSEMLDIMIENGVDSMPGGGAEIFDEKVRNHICKGKVSSENWLEIHKLWHQKNKKSTATMLFGHVEERTHRIDHMIRLREIQDKTNGFTAFIPLVYQRYNNYLKVKTYFTGVEALKTIAISRLMLDNFPHIKAYWVTSTINLAILAQEFGADDLDGTISKETIQSSAGAKSANGMSLEEINNHIIGAGFEPTQRDSLYS